MQQQADMDTPARGTPDRMHKVTLLYAIAIENTIKGKVVPDAGVDMQTHLLRMHCFHAMLSEHMANDAAIEKLVGRDGLSPEDQALVNDEVARRTLHWEVRDALISTTSLFGAGLSGYDFVGSAISDPALFVRDPVPTVVPECVLAFLDEFAPNRA
jgi:hypothetical protein